MFNLHLLRKIILLIEFLSSTRFSALPLKLKPDARRRDSLKGSSRYSQVQSEIQRSSIFFIVNANAIFRRSLFELLSIDSFELVSVYRLCESISVLIYL